jgi:hypothetical protein
MEISDLPAANAKHAPREERASARRRGGWEVAIFASAIFLSAALLFLIEPMFTKMVLPRLGGSPSVWSVALVFFQSALVAGYAYAHWLTRSIRHPYSILVHLLVLLGACTALPLTVAARWEHPPPSRETMWLIALFAASIGLPFFALAGNGPLLQSWLSGVASARSIDPYRLFAISNMGSLLALLSYPFLIEPLLGLTDQTWYWSLGFYLLLAIVAGCGYVIAKDNGPHRQACGVAPAEPVEITAPSWQDCGLWLLLSAVPAGLLIAVTAHISTDIAAVPLLWVIPLALYLLSFVAVFARHPLIPQRLVLAAQPLFIIALVAFIVFEPTKKIIWLVSVHLAVFFVCALMCHGELARTRPRASQLTAFYLCIAAGGMIGGLAAGVIAPHAFNWVAEYPVLIALAVLCRPPIASAGQGLMRALGFTALAAAGLFLLLCTFFRSLFDEPTFNRAVAGLLIASVPFWRSPLPLAAIVGSILVAEHTLFEQPGTLSVRSFFGVAKVLESPDGQFRILQHGTTLHGAERIRDPYGRPVTGAPEPLLYYYNGSGIAQSFDAVRARAGGAIRTAVIGLGAGALACQAHPNDTLEFYEIDPAIVRIARDSNLFSFLSMCRPDTPITLGDARLELKQAPSGAYDLIIVDAFSSDAIPIHLLTREAMAEYLEKLSPNGLIVMHISNRHLELASVVAGIAAANNLLTLVSDGPDLDEAANPYKFAGTVAALARRMTDFGPLADSPDWEQLQPDPRQSVWTDDYSNVAGALLRKFNE